MVHAMMAMHNPSRFHSLSSTHDFDRYNQLMQDKLPILQETKDDNVFHDNDFTKVEKKVKDHSQELYDWHC